MEITNAAVAGAFAAFGYFGFHVRGYEKAGNFAYVLAIILAVSGRP